MHIGEVVCHGVGIWLHNLESRRTNKWQSAIRIRRHAYDQGRGCHGLDRGLVLPLPSHARIVYLDVRVVWWCSFDSVAFRSFVWPRDSRMAEHIVRTLRGNHCQWVDVFVVRGRCPGIRKNCARPSRILDDQLRSWIEATRPFILHMEGHGDCRGGNGLPEWAEPCGGDPVPGWIDECYCFGKCMDYRQCSLLGRWGFHHPGVLYSVLWTASFGDDMCRDQSPGVGPKVDICWCSMMKWHYPWECRREHAKGDRIAANFSSIAIRCLCGNPFPVPPGWPFVGQ